MLNPLTIIGSRHYLIKWIVLFLIYLIFEITFLYPDLFDTYSHSLMLLDCISEGKPFDFYYVTQDNANSTDGWPANYAISIYVLFAIWSLPCWMISKIGLLSPFSPLCLIWAKLLVFISCVGVLVFFYRLLDGLLDDCSGEKKDLWTFVLASSMLFCMTALNGFYDSIELLFGLWGLWLLSRERTPSVKTLLLLSLSISIKYFMVFPIAIWLLLKEKRVLWICIDLLILASVTVVSILLFLPSFRAVAGPFQGTMLEKMLTVSISSNLYPIPLFFLTFFACCLIAFLAKPQDLGRDSLSKLNWLTCVYFLGFIFFVSRGHPQWVTLAMPFIVLLIAQKESLEKLNLLLESVFELTLILVQSVYYYGVFMTNTHSNATSLVFQNVNCLSLVFSEPQSFSSIVTRLGFDGLMPAVMALAFLALIALIVINAPRKSILDRRTSFLRDGRWSRERAFRNGMIVYRIIALAVVYLLSMIIVFVL